MKGVRISADVMSVPNSLASKLPNNGRGTKNFSKKASLSGEGIFALYMIPTSPSHMYTVDRVGPSSSSEEKQSGSKEDVLFEVHNIRHER